MPQGAGGEQAERTRAPGSYLCPGCPGQLVIEGREPLPALRAAGGPARRLPVHRRG